MKKHVRFLALLVALLLPWATQAQSLANYAFTTGTDATMWVSMTDATQILSPSGSDGLASAVQNIGFSFPFGASSYTQYSVNTDGNLRLGSTATSTGTYTTPFSSANAGTNSPKINAFGCDGYGNSGSHYVKAKQYVTPDLDTMLVVEFCTGTYNTTTRGELYKWQIHLHTNGNIDMVFPDASAMPDAGPNVAHQCGLCASSSDGWVISSATNTAEHFTNGSSITNALGTWFDANRYYSFIHPSNISCFGPTNLTVSNVTSAGATISWTSGGTETEWELTVDGDTYYPTTTTYTVTNLDGNTPYVANVRAICGVGDTSYASSISFRTACVQISSMPYTNDFESDPSYSGVAYAQAFPYCWTRINDASGTYNYYPYLTTTANYVHSGGVGMYWYHTTTTSYANNQYAVLPPVDLSVYNISDLTLAFYAKTTSTSYHPQPIVGVMTNPTNASTFTPVYTFTATEVTTDWQLFVIPLSSYTGTGNYIAIKWPRTSSTCYLAIDDIYLTDDWCNAPTNVVASSTDSEVTLRWNPNGGSHFTVICGTDTINGVYDSTYTFTGRTSDSIYHYSVATECTSGNSLYMSGTIRTECAPLTDSDLPYTEDFESYGTGSAAAISTCWRKGVVALLGTGTTTNFPYPYNTAAINGTRGLYFYAARTSSTAYYNWATLPRLDASVDITNLELDFLIKRTSTASHTTNLVVGVSSDITSESAFVPVDTINLSSAAVSTTHAVTVSFENYTGNGQYILLYAPAPTSATTYNAFYLDDITLHAAAACPTPQGVTVTRTTVDSVYVTWDGNTEVSSWAVYIGTPGFSIDTVIPEYVYDTVAGIGNLNPNTAYELVVVAGCGNSESFTSFPVYFRTQCSPLTSLPFVDNFDGVTGATTTSVATNNLPPCWLNWNTGTSTSYSGYPIVYNSATYAHSGSQAMRFYTYITTGTYSDQISLMPLTDSSLYPVQNMQVSFWMRSNSTSYNSWVVVGVMSDPSDASTFVPVQTIYTNSSTTYAQHTVRFANYTGPHGRIAFKAPQPASGYNYLYIDDVILEELPSCTPVTSLQAQTTASSARLTWDYDAMIGAPLGYDVSYRYTSDSPASLTTISFTGPEAVLTGLDADTSYWVSVVADCGGEYGVPCTTTFSTQALPHSTCAAPLVNFSEDSVGDYVLSWIPGYQETSWDVAYHRADSNGWITVASSTNNTEYTFLHSDLQPTTSYEFRVTALCSDTNISATVNYTTPCDYIHIPYTYGFEDMATTSSSSHPNIPCWHHLNNGTSYPGYPYISSTAHNSTRSLYWYGSITTGTYGDYQVVVLPPVNVYDTPIRTLQMTFWAKPTSTSYAPIFLLGVMTDPTDITTFETVTTISLDHTTTNWMYYEAPLRGYTGNGQYIALRANRPSSAWYAYVDDITIESAPTCPRVDNVEVRNITQTDATIEWDTTNAYEYEVEYGPAGFNHGSGTIVSNIYDDTVVLSGLTSGTLYDVYVRGVCDDDSSNWSFVLQFATNCDYATLPLFEDFDNVTGSTATSGMANILPPCWDYYNDGTRANYQGCPYVYTNTTNAHSGTNSIRFYTYNSSGDSNQYLILPVLDSNVYQISNLQMSFWLRGNSASASYHNDVIVGVMTNPMVESSFIPFDTIISSTTTYAFHEVVFTGYTGPHGRITLMFPKPASSSTYEYGYIDDVTLEPIPDCPPVSNITAAAITSDSLYVTWTENGYATQWDVEYGPAGFTLGTGTYVTSYYDTVAIGGLTANTEYDVYITPYCVGGSAAARMGTFRTNCGAVSVPFSESFDTWSTTAADPLPTCWEKHTNYSTNYPNASTTYSHSGGKAMYMYSTNTTYSYMVLPQFALPIDSTRVTFWIYKANTSYTHKLQVGVISNPADVSTFVQVAEVAPSAVSTWEEVEVNLSSYTGTGTRIAIMSPNNEYSYPYLDDLSVSRISSCSRVDDLRVVDVRLDSLIIAWSDTNSAHTSWIVEYDTVNFTPGAGTVTPILVNDSTYTLSGLDSGTTYHIYVYPDCNGDVAERHITATTLAASPATVPYSCDFEAAGTNGWDLYTTGQANYWMVGNATGNTGRSLYVTNDGSTNNYTITSLSYSYAVRVLNLSDTGDYAYSFDWKGNGEGNYDFIRALLVPASMDIAAGQSLFGSSPYNYGQTVAPAPWIDLTGKTTTPYGLNMQTTWQNRTGVVHISTPGYYKLVFSWTNDASGGTTPPGAIDNVSFTLNSCAMPQNVTAAVFSDSIRLTWAPGGTESAWEVTRGTNSVVVTTPAYTFTGLTPNSNYTIFIRSICNVGDTSLAYTETYHTPCAAVSLPFSQNFDGLTTSTTAATGVHVPCWNFIMTGSSTYQGTSYQPQVYYSSTYAHSGSYSLRLYGESYTMLPPMSAPLDSLRLTFWDYPTAAAYLLQVGVMEGNTFVPIEAINTPASTHLQHTVYFGAYTGNSRIIAFRNYNSTPTTYYSYHYIDDVVVDYLPACPPVSNITADSATETSITVSWAENGSATSWDIEYGLHGFTRGTGTTATVNTTPTYTLTGLVHSTAYDVYVSPRCTSGAPTAIMGTVRTLCGAVTLPYTENFDSYTTSTTAATGVEVPCWDYIMTGSATYQAVTYQPRVYYSSSYAHSGNYSLRLYGESYTMLPPMSAPLDSLQLTFWDYCTGAAYLLEVGVMEGTTFVPVQTINTPASTHQEHTIYFGAYTGNSRIIAFRNYNSSSTSYLSYHYIDNVAVDYIPTCPPVVGITSTGASTSSITVDWTDQAMATAWQIEYGHAGYTFGSTAGTRMSVNSHPAVITGLDTLTAYDIYVRPICSATDTGSWSNAATLMTAMCENAHIVSTDLPTSTSGTTYYYPVNNYFKYTLSETIIDSAELNGPMDIQTIAYYYDHTAAITDKPNCTIYFQPTTRSTFSTSSDIVAVDTATAVRVYVGDFNFSQGWNYLTLDTVYHYSGTGNLLVIVDDNSNDYNASGYNYRTKSCTGNKTIAYYSDSYDPDAFTVTSSYSGSKAVYAARVDMQLISCGAAGCRAPAVTSTTTTYQSGTVNWAGSGFAYEVSYKTTDATSWSAEIPVTTSSYTFTGLQPATVYMFRVRQDCTADSLGYSVWTEGFFTTDSLPCLAPDSLTALSSTNTTATFGWTARGNETAWDIRVFNTTTDTTYTVTTNPATVGGLHAGVTYYAAIRALCGNAQNIPGDWSDSIQFTTQVCPTVTGVTTSNVTFNSVTLNWPAATLAQGYEVEYGMHGFTQGNGTSLPATTNSLTVSGLMDETQYDFYVRAVCGTNWHSENWSTLVTATTLSAPSTTFNITATVNPTNAGTVTGTGVYGLGDTATLTATANTGYTFNRWNDNVTLNPRSVVVTSDSAFTALFTINEYTVTVTSADQTRGTVAGGGTYHHGDTATLTATAATGYHFTQWNDGDTHIVRTLVVTSDTAFTASFGVNQYTVTATANDARYGTVTGGGTYNFRDTVTLTATANTGYYFRSWNDGNVDNPRTFVVTDDVAYTALFAADSVPPVQNYTVTLNANDANMGIVNGAGTFAEGTSVEISAIANAGYRFVNWNDGVTENPRTFVLTCDTTFTANFAELVDSSAVLVVSFDSEMGYVLINGAEASSYNGLLGDEVSLEAIANEGYHFVEWSDGETSRTRTITLEQSRTTLTATFAVGSGIATVENSASCLIYPNPATRSTTISVSGVNGKVRIAVVDINGRVAASETMECAGDCVKTMNVDNLSQGAYFVRITGKKVNMVKKLIVR